MAVNILNPKADVLRRSAALSSNCNAAKGLQEVLRSNLGPRGTLKMLVGGAGQIKITKDGNVLLGEMQIQHPTASMIARAATAQDDVTGDGTTSSVLLIGEMMRQGERFVLESNVHPKILCQGIEAARKELMRFLDSEESNYMKVPVYEGDEPNKEILLSVARTSLRSKIHPKLADFLTPLAVDAVLLIRASQGHTNSILEDKLKSKEDAHQIDLFMIEILHMIHRNVDETRLIKGMCLDHGARHPDMPQSLKKCYILTLNVSLEYEKSEVNSGFFYSDVGQRDRLVVAEREFTDKKVRQIIELKRRVCTEENKCSFVILNQKGIDPPSLDMLAKENIIALRRVKRRNMERLTLCCGGEAVNCVDDLCESDLGYAEHVYQQNLGEDKYTFVEGVRNPLACTILLKGPNDYSIAQMKDGFRDALRAVKTALEDRYVLPGAGAFEAICYQMLQKLKKKTVGKQIFGIDLLADGLLYLPKTLIENSGLDAQDSILALIHEYNQSKENALLGLDLITGNPFNPVTSGIFDTYRTKRHMLSIAPTLAQNLLQIDEVIRAGKSMTGGNPQ